MKDSFDVRIVPLGGLGRIGANMLVVETRDDIVVVDCGVLFGGPDEPGVDYLIPDPTYLLERKDKLRAFVLTHAHEDHLGAIPFIWPLAQAPIYASPFTAAMLESRLDEYPELRPTIHRFGDGESQQFGSIGVRTIPVTHSIPGAQMLALSTPVGTLIHTGDFKLDPTPIDGRLSDLDTLSRLGDEGITLLMSDSTNSEKDGHTWSEAEVVHDLDLLVREAPQRVLVTCFASNVHRVQTILDAAQKARRKVILAGQSMQRIISLALAEGALDSKRHLIVDPASYDALGRREVMVLASGSQGEPRSTVTRIAAGSHDIALEAGDRVIFSSRKIPGNERPISKVVNNFLRLGCELFDDRAGRIHTSGHAFGGEQEEVIRRCRPTFFMPLHGELRQMMKHRARAESCGVQARNTFVLEMGQSLELSGRAGDAKVRRGPAVQAGYWFIEGEQQRQVPTIVVDDRKKLAEVGFVTVTATLDREGRLVAGPSVSTRGVIHVDQEEELLVGMEAAAKVALLEAPDRADDEAKSEAMRSGVRRFCRRELGKRPLVVPTLLRTYR